MTLQEILKSQGLSDEQIETITGEMKQNKIFTSGQENLDIRYSKLKQDHEGQAAELKQANDLIAELQKSVKGNEQATAQIAAYQEQVAKLQEELQQQKVEAAIKVGLLSEHALDVDYLTFKLKEKGELELDEHGDIKGWDDKIAALKTQMPGQFEQTQQKRVDPNRLPSQDGDEGGLTRADVLKMPYGERAKLAAEHPDTYNEVMRG